MKFTPFIFPTSFNDAMRLGQVRELSENCMIRPAPKVLGCRPLREFVTPKAKPLFETLNFQPSTIN